MNIILPSLPALSDYFNTDYALVQLTLSAYLAMTAVLQLITGPLSDRYGRRPVILGSLTIFIVATLVTTMATSFEMFLTARLLQAAIVTGYTLSRAMVRDMVPMHQAASMIGYVTMGMALVPMIGPGLGGLLEENYGWQSIYYLMSALGLITLIVVWFDQSETNQNRSTSFTAQFRSYPELLRSRRFWGYAFSVMFASGSYFAFLGGAPYVAENYFGLTPAIVGSYFASLAIGYIIGNFFSGRYAGKIGIAKMMLIGTIVTAIGIAIAIAAALAGASHAASFFFPLISVGLGNGLTLPSANAGLVSVRPHLAGSASGLGGAIMIGGGAALSVFAGIVLTPTSGPAPLLWLMEISALFSIAATLYTNRIERTFVKHEA